MIEALQRKLKQANSEISQLKEQLEKEKTSLRNERDRLEELKEEHAHQVDELENQMDKLKEQLQHLQFLQEKLKKETEMQNADNFVTQMSKMYSSIGMAPNAGPMGTPSLGQTDASMLQPGHASSTTVQNFNFINIEGQSADLAEK